MIKLTGIKRVRKRLADGTVRKFHYAWVGGPCFWRSDSPVREGSPEYVEAFAATAEARRGAPATRHGLSVPQAADRFRDSGEFRALAARTQADYARWLTRIGRDFFADALVMFEARGARVEALDWRDRWRHSPKQADYAATVLVRLLNWSVERGLLREHHCHDLPRLYRSGRAEIIWPPAAVAAFEARAPVWVRRILVAALETGLRPGDLVRLARGHVEPTEAGRRIVVRTAKRGRVASLPVTPRMAEILDTTPAGRLLILTNGRGAPLTTQAASKAVRYWREAAGLPEELRLYDCRGTATTALLRAGASLDQIATWFGWSLRHAGTVIQHYAATCPEGADEVLSLLARRKPGT